jgi:hypothetical protein
VQGRVCRRDHRHLFHLLNDIVSRLDNSYLVQSLTMILGGKELIIEVFGHNPHVASDMLIQHQSSEHRRLVLTTSSLALAPVCYRGMLDDSRHFGGLPALYNQGV